MSATVRPVRSSIRRSMSTKRVAQLPGEDPADRGLARAHEAHQDDPGRARSGTARGLRRAARRTPGRRPPRTRRPRSRSRPRRRARPRRGTSRCGGRRASARARRAAAAPPSTTRPSGRSRTRAPSAARPSARAAMRSLSLTRSSPAPVIVKGPSRAGRGHGQGRHLVDERGHEDAGRPSSRAASTSGPRSSRSARGRSPRGAVSTSAAHGPQHVEEGGAGGVEQDAVEADLGVGQDERGHHQEGRARGVAGHDDVRPAQARAAADGGGEALALDRSRRRPAAAARCGRGSGLARGRWCVPSACRPARRTAVFTCALATGRS